MKDAGLTSDFRRLFRRNGRLAHLPVPRLRIFHLNQQAVVAPAQFITWLVMNRFYAGNETHCVSNLDPMLRWGGWLRSGHHEKAKAGTTYDFIRLIRGEAHPARLSSPMRYQKWQPIRTATRRGTEAVILAQRLGVAPLELRIT